MQQSQRTETTNPEHLRGRDTEYRRPQVTVTSQYYTIIDFNEVVMRIYQPEKVIFIGAAR